MAETDEFTGEQLSELFPILAIEERVEGFRLLASMRRTSSS